MPKRPKKDEPKISSPGAVNRYGLTRYWPAGDKYLDKSRPGKAERASTVTKDVAPRGMPVYRREPPAGTTFPDLPAYSKPFLGGKPRMQIPDTGPVRLGRKKGTKKPWV